MKNLILEGDVDSLNRTRLAIIAEYPKLKIVSETACVNLRENVAKQMFQTTVIFMWYEIPGDIEIDLKTILANIQAAAQAPRILAPGHKVN